MKRINLTFTLLSLLAGCVLSSCGKEDIKYCTITFKQENCSDRVVQVVSGESLAEVPNPNAKVGYTVVWDKTDFSSVTEDTIVTAISTANTYVVTYSAPSFEIDGTTTSLTYDSVCSSLDMSLTAEEQVFVGWSYNNTIYTNQSIWNVADNVTLNAYFVSTTSTKVTVTFVDSNGTVIIKTVEKGETLTDIPTPTAQVGYSSVVWDRTDFTNLTEDLVVYTVKTPKTYIVNLDANGGQVSQNQVSVIYGETYTLEKPIHDEFGFVTWKYNGQDVALSGTWNLDIESGVFNLIAQWGDSEWTIIY